MACETQGQRTRATDVDHEVPHAGNRARFFDAANLQSLCHPCHSRKTALEGGWAGHVANL